ncbi:hypothetical protein [Microbacterium sp. B24]|uniref:hypothetical protein n=1 Tax=Microbacterium sp. B24 TaxID=95616 RepID=UPI001EF9FE3A|nr:hypothetical protein [Microbacterium sp. B24]
MTCPRVAWSRSRRSASTASRIRAAAATPSSFDASSTPFASPTSRRCEGTWPIDTNFLAAIVNDTDTDETLLVGVEGTTQRVPVAAHSTVSLGFDGAEPLLFTGLSAKPGTDVRTTFQSGTGEAVEDRVPVLDGTLSYLKDFVPAN